MSDYNENFNEDIASDIANNPVAQKGKQAVLNKAKSVAKNLVKNGVKLLSKALLAILKLLLPYLLIIGAVLLVIIIGYFLIFEFTGTEKEYTKAYENDYIYNEDNVMIVTDSEMNGENKTIRDFYRYFSGQSFYQLVGSDNNTLIYPDDENSPRDYYNREDSFKLNSNLLFSLDEYMYGAKWKYPEQFIKPVKYNPDDLTLVQLVDEEGFVTAESDEEDIDTGIKTGEKILSVRDYGLSSILKYNEKKQYERTLLIKGFYTGEDVWNPHTKQVEYVEYSKPVEFEVPLKDYPQDIYIIDKVVSFVGEIEFFYEDKDKKFEDLRFGQTREENEPFTEYIFDTYTQDECEDYFFPDSYFDSDTEQWCIYKVHDLIRHRSEDTVVVERLPVVVKTEVNDEGDIYLREYLYNFESYIPIDTINDFEFGERIDYDSYVFDYDALLTDDYGFNLGSHIDSGAFKQSLQYLPIVEKYASRFGVDPYIVIAMIAQESSGNPRINANGLMQITSGGDTTITATNVDGVSETFTLEKLERQDVEKSIQYGTMYFKYLLELMDNNPYKAIQAYNFGEGTMGDIRNNHSEAWNSNFGWMLFREEARISRGGEDSRSASYECMAFPEGRKLNGKYWGDSCYLENVLRYYAGADIDSISDIESGSNAWNPLKTLGDLFMKFVTKREKTEIIPKSDYIGHARPEKVSDVLKTTIALDESVLFSEADEDATSLNFWDEGFMSSMTSMGASLQDILDIAPNKDGYFPPINLNEDGLRISSYFGWRIHPTLLVKKFHTGVDIAAPQGTHIYTIADGIVTTARYSDTAGNFIIVDHGNGVESVYMHLYKFAVNVGDAVQQGDMIGEVGTTGRSTGPHLHFEFRVGNSRIDPLGIITGE